MSESAELLVVNEKESYLKQMPRGHSTGGSCVKDMCQCASDGVAQGEKWGLGGVIMHRMPSPTGPMQGT